MGDYSGGGGRGWWKLYAELIQKLKRIGSGRLFLIKVSFLDLESFISSSSSSSSSSSNRNSSSSLLELMRVSDMSESRLIIRYGVYFPCWPEDYCASPITRFIFLWGNDSCEDDHLTYAWSPVKLLTRLSSLSSSSCYNSSRSGLMLAPEGDGTLAKERYISSLMKKKEKLMRSRKQRLTRKRSYTGPCPDSGYGGERALDLCTWS